MLGKINTYSHLQGEEYHQNWVHRTSGIPTEFKGGIRAVAMDPLEPHKGRYYRTPHAESAQFPSLLLLLTDSQDSLQKNQSIYGQMVRTRTAKTLFKKTNQYMVRWIHHRCDHVAFCRPFGDLNIIWAWLTENWLAIANPGQSETQTSTNIMVVKSFPDRAACPATGLL